MSRDGRSSLLLSELTIAVLFFSLSAVVALGVFLSSYQQSLRSGETLSALGRARDALEELTARAWEGVAPGDALTEMGFADVLAPEPPRDASPREYASDEGDGRLRALVSREEAAAGVLWRVTLAYEYGGADAFSLPCAVYVARGAPTPPEAAAEGGDSP